MQFINYDTLGRWLQVSNDLPEKDRLELVQRNAPVVFLLVLPLDFQFVDVNFGCSVVNKARETRQTNVGLQYKI
jgi:hypothetical protein